MAAARTIRFNNGFSMDLALEGKRFLGIGEVRCGRRVLRSAALPWTFYTESETGFRFDEFRLKDVRRSGQEAILLFTSEGRWLPRLQAADAMGDARIATRSVKRPVARFRWTFRTVTEAIEENEWTGLAMQLHVDSPGHPIHWVLEDATWEIGGRAAGCTLIQQDVSTIDLEQAVRASSAFSTIEKFFTPGWGGSYPMDMLPRAAGAAICDFQVREDTALVLLAERPGLTRARIEKRMGENVIHYTDRPFFLLTEHARAPERKLLVYRHPQALKRHEWRNLWLDCFTEVRRRILDEYGFKPEVPLPTIGAHLWDADLNRHGPAWTEPLIRAFPEFAKLGYREVMTFGVWESVTSDPARTIEDGNICCPYAFRFAEAFGGAAGMKRLLDAAHANSIQIYQWFGFQFAKFAPIWKEHPDWILREANGDPWDANYQILSCGRMRSPFRNHILAEIKKVKDDTGLDSIFWDSYQNLGVTCVDWQAPDKAPQADEIWTLQAELQRYGFKQRAEVVTIFGVSQVALYGFEGDQFRRRLWRDTVRNDDAFALLDTSPCFFTDGDPFTADRLSPTFYFWLAGHRAVPILNARPWDKPLDPSHAGHSLPGGALAEHYARVNRLYNAALPHMHRLRLTPHGDCTLWLDAGGQPSVLWAFRDGQIEFTGEAADLETGRRLDAERTLRFIGGKVYRLRSGPAPDLRCVRDR